jgi:hypothetical protein
MRKVVAGGRGPRLMGHIVDADAHALTTIRTICDRSIKVRHVWGWEAWNTASTSFDRCKSCSHLSEYAGDELTWTGPTGGETMKGAGR